jgi:hypothetical protein
MKEEWWRPQERAHGTTGSIHCLHSTTCLLPPATCLLALAIPHASCRPCPPASTARLSTCLCANLTGHAPANQTHRSFTWKCRCGCAWLGVLTTRLYRRCKPFATYIFASRLFPSRFLTRAACTVLALASPHLSSAHPCFIGSRWQAPARPA